MTCTGLYCYAGIPEPSLYQFLCKVAIHIRQSRLEWRLWIAFVWQHVAYYATVAPVLRLREGPREE